MSKGRFQIIGLLLTATLLAVVVWMALGPRPISADSRAATGEGFKSQLDPAPGAPSTVEEPKVSRRGSSSIESDELIALGEFGLLPSLLQTINTGVDCDFDDALSTCQ